jgi:hypothetical protein
MRDLRKPSVRIPVGLLLAFLGVVLALASLPGPITAVWNDAARASAGWPNPFVLGLGMLLAYEGWSWLRND